MVKAAVGVVAGCIVFAVLFGGCVAALGEGGDAQGGSGGPAGSSIREDGPAVPSGWELLDQGAAATCPGLAWSVLAAIGRVESDSGRSSAPGVANGANSAGAEGPMQFESATFARYGVVGPGGADPPSPYDPVDAIYSAAKLLCADGAARPSTLFSAIDDYNHSLSYVETVVVLAQALSSNPSMPADAAGALAFANHVERGAVFHRSAGVEEFGLGVDFDAGKIGIQLREAKQRRVPDQLQYGTTKRR